MKTGYRMILAAMVTFGVANYANAETATTSTHDASIVVYETEWNTTHSSEAAYKLGLIYAAQGSNNTKATEWFKKAADMGHTQADTFYRYLNAQVQPQAVPIVKAAAKTPVSNQVTRSSDASRKTGSPIATELYTTRSGDTLYHIAMRYLHGQGRKATRTETLGIASQIHASNLHAFYESNQDKLRVGKALTMPGGSKDLPAELVLADTSIEKPAMAESSQKQVLQPIGIPPAIKADIEADLKAKYEILLSELEQKKNAEIAQLNKEKETAESQLKLVQSEKDALMEKYLNQDVIIAGLQSQNSKLVAKSETAAQDLLTLQAENQLYQQTTDQLEEQLVQKDTKIEQTENQLSLYKESSQRYETQLANLKQSVSQVSQLIAGITAENDMDANASPKLVSVESGEPTEVPVDSSN